MEFGTNENGARHDGRGEQLEVVGDAGIPELAEFFVSNFWEEDVAPSQVNAEVPRLLSESSISRIDYDLYNVDPVSTIFWIQYLDHSGPMSRSYRSYRSYRSST